MPLKRLVFSLLVLWGVACQAQVHHDLVISIDPSTHELEVTDRITFPAAANPLSLLLHAGLKPEVQGEGARLTSLTPVRGNGVPLERLVVTRAPHVESFTLRYAGRIHHPIDQLGQEYARSFSVSPGLVAPEGVYLSGASYWVPQIADRTVTFTLTVTLPADWRSMSQGRLVRHASASHVRETWSIDAPQEEIYLIAGPFKSYHDTAGAVQAMVLLRQDDAALARKYLGATQQYIALYRDLIGPYPYSKFALVENFWETGYGMPSFTLLGPRVIRFPFILHSSYPHEILHNWWGNGVYVDYERGNWAEGLTSYLADHLVQEQRGQGVAYRRQVLQKYTDYVREQKDFPLTAFRSRHSSVTEAVGYGKTLMLFHMLRQQLGDERFIDALQRLYRRYQFKIAAFDDVARVFTAVAGQPLNRIFQQWVERSGAPVLQVAEARAKPLADGTSGFLLSARIEQTQAGAAYELIVPIAVYLEGRERAYQSRIVMRDKQYRLDLKVASRPLRLDIDPEFDVFRRLHRNEIPPALTQAFGADRALIVLPASAPEALQAAYQQLAATWARPNASDVEVTFDHAVTDLPKDRAVWLLGWDNRFRPALEQALSAYEVALADDVVRLDGQTLTRQRHSVVLVARHPKNPDAALTWIATDHVAALPGLGRKLPHYGKYSYLGFTGDAPDQVAKGQWPVIASPMSVAVEPSAGRSVTTIRAELAPRAALATPPPVFSSQRMQRDIDFLADPAMAGRGLDTVELDRAAAYLADQFRQAGLQPGGDRGSYVQTWSAAVDGLGPAVELKNVIGVLPGSNPAYTSQSVVLGAHYDHLGRGWPDVRAGHDGKAHPGADDNASGVAVMLELARVLGNWQPERSVVWIAFTGEEAGKLDSRHYVDHARAYPVAQVIGMLNLDTVGRLGNNPLFVLGSASASEWMHIFRGASYVTGVPVQVVADDYGASDQTSFIARGVPAVQLFSCAHADYHSPGDSADKIDADGLVKVAAVAKEAVEYLASRPYALTVTWPGLSSSQPASTSGRRVLLGTVPDFAFTGPGVRLSGVTADTPAARAGLREGDIIIRLNDVAVDDLRGYAELLKSLQPGDKTTIGFLRDGRERHTIAAPVTR
jgi:hypothetical protein